VPPSEPPRSSILRHGTSVTRSDSDDDESNYMKPPQLGLFVHRALSPLVRASHEHADPMSGITPPHRLLAASNESHSGGSDQFGDLDPFVVVAQYHEGM
jgi:hypothetical protein